MPESPPFPLLCCTPQQYLFWAFGAFGAEEEATEPPFCPVIPVYSIGGADFCHDCDRERANQKGPLCLRQDSVGGGLDRPLVRWLRSQLAPGLADRVRVGELQTARRPAEEVSPGDYAGLDALSQLRVWARKHGGVVRPAVVGQALAAIGLFSSRETAVSLLYKAIRQCGAEFQCVRKGRFQWTKYVTKESAKRPRRVSR